MSDSRIISYLSFSDLEALHGLEQLSISNLRTETWKLPNTNSQFKCGKVFQISELEMLNLCNYETNRNNLYWKISLQLMWVGYKGFLKHLKEYTDKHS